MAFNDGSGTEIKLSQIAGYYGGDQPFQLSNYYKGSRLVPAATFKETRTPTQTRGNSSQVLTRHDSGNGGRYIDFAFHGHSNVDVVVPWKRQWSNLSFVERGGAYYISGGTTVTQFASSIAEYHYTVASGGWKGRQAGNYNPSQFGANFQLGAAWEIISGEGVSVTFTGGLGDGGVKKGGISSSYPNWWQHIPGYIDFSVPTWDGTGDAPTSLLHSGTIEFSGDTGAENCIIRIGFGEYVSWYEHLSYAPGQFSSGYLTDQVVGQLPIEANANIPTSADVEITLDDFNQVTDPHTLKPSS